MRVAVSYITWNDSVNRVPFWDNPGRLIFTQHGKIFETGDFSWKKYAKYLIEDNRGVVRVFVNGILVWSPTMNRNIPIDTYQPVFNEKIEVFRSHYC